MSRHNLIIKYIYLSPIYIVKQCGYHLRAIFTSNIINPLKPASRGQIKQAINPTITSILYTRDLSFAIIVPAGVLAFN